MKGNFIDKRKTENFTIDAKKKLEEYVLSYADCIIKEANLIEEANREQGASREITANIIVQAVGKNQKRIKKKKKIAIWVCEMITILGPVFLGLLFSDRANWMQNIYEMWFFVLVTVIIILACVYKFLCGE